MLELSNLLHVRLLNIKNLTLEQHSFSWNDSTIYDVYPSNGIEIRVENSTVSNLPSYLFRGRIDAIIFDHVRVHLIHSYAFTSLAGTRTIQFRDCHFFVIQNQAFKKFTVEETFSIMGGHFAATLPSRTIMDVAVRDEFRINGVIFDRIRSSAFHVHGPRKFQLQNCYVAHIEGEAFVVHTRGPVFVDDNVFHTMEKGALFGFNVERHELEVSGHQEFVFENNTIAEVDRASLLFNINSFIPKLDWIYLNTQCECRTLPNWLSDLIIYTRQYPEEKIPPQIKLDEIISCRNVDNDYTRLKDYSSGYCGQRTQSLQMVAFLSVIAVLVFLAILVFYWVWCKNKKGRWINVPQSSPTHDPHESMPMRAPPSPCYEEPSTSHTMAAADKRAHRSKETEMHVIVECAEPVQYVNPFREQRTQQIYSNRCVELGHEYANRRSVSYTHLTLPTIYSV